MDSKENMAKLASPYVILSSYADGIVYLWRLQKSLKFAIIVGLESKICRLVSRPVPAASGTSRRELTSPVRDPGIPVSP